MNYNNLHIDAMCFVLLIGWTQQHSCKGWTHQRGRQNFTGAIDLILLHTLIHTYNHPIDPDDVFDNLFGRYSWSKKLNTLNWISYWIFLYLLKT